MADIAELGYKVDSSGLLEGTKALDDNAAAADKAGGAAERLEKDYQALARTIDRSSSALGDRLGGALDRIGTGTGAVIAELQALNRTNVEMLASLGALDGKLSSTAGQVQAYGAAGAAAAASTTQVAAASEKLEQELAQQEARYKAVAQQAMAWTQGNQAANLSERALAEAARDAALGIDQKARALASAGTEQERMVARVRALEEAEARATNEQRQAAAAADAQKINLQQLLGQIDPTVAALNRLAAMEDRLERAQKAGLINTNVFDQYQAKIEGMRAAVLKNTNAQDGMALSAGQLRQSMRMLPMQVTDITTSLISGQPAWMVAIQQGGQLKDQFGGIGPAARAVGGYVIGLVNPLTVGAAALAAMALAAKQGQDRLFEYQKELILSGNGAMIGAAGFEALAQSIDQLEGVSRGGAAAALTETAKAGRFAGEQFELVAAAAARMEASTGRSAAATVGAFQSIAKEPLEGLLKLNDAERFLTLAQVQRIASLQEEGRSQQATNEAIQIYASHLDNVADQTEAIMPGMSRAWRDVKDDIGGAWSALGDFTGGLVDLAGEWGVLARLPRLSDMLGLGVVGGTLVKNLGLPSLTEALNGVSSRIRGLPPLPAAIDEGSLDPRAARELVTLGQERVAAERSAAEAINAQVAGLDRATAKEAARLKIIAQYNQLADNDARHFDGSMQQLIAKAQRDVDKQFDRAADKAKRNTDDSAAQSLLANVQRQITANEQLAESGTKVTASDRLVIQTRQLLEDKTNTMTASTRKLLEALIPTLQATDAAGQAEVQRQRGMQASIALTERLSQLEKQRQEQAQVDLMGLGLGRGADATAMLQRQLDIQRQYLDETEKLDKAQRDKSTALSQSDYQQQQLALQASLERSLDIERSYQQQRMALLGDWRTGVTRVWEDYVSSATNASEQAGTVVSNTLTGWEDMWVRAAKTGKLSFSDLANSVIADMARMASKQAALGLFGNALGGLFGGNSAPSTYSAQSFGNNTGWLTDGLSFGGGRARGGGVNRGSFYEVGEGGRPELLEQNGKQYLIPGNNGRVIPAAPSAGGAASGGGSYKVEINNHGGGQVQTRQTTERMPDGSQLKKLVIDIVGESLDGGDLGSLGRNKYGWQEAVG